MLGVWLPRHCGAMWCGVVWCTSIKGSHSCSDFEREDSYTVLRVARTFTQSINQSIVGGVMLRWKDPAQDGAHSTHVKMLCKSRAQLVAENNREKGKQ